MKRIKENNAVVFFVKLGIVILGVVGLSLFDWQ
jgi:hypothetical protein